MSVKVTRVDNEPILIAHLTGKINSDDIREIFRQSQRLMEKIEGRVFRITDVREITSSFAEVTAGIKEAAGGDAGSTSDPRLTVIFVGSNQWAELYRSAMHLKQYAGKEIPFFSTMAEAMHFIRVELDKREEV